MDFSNPKSFTEASIGEITRQLTLRHSNAEGNTYWMSTVPMILQEFALKMAPSLSKDYKLVGIDIQNRNQSFPGQMATFAMSLHSVNDKGQVFEIEVSVGDFVVVVVSLTYASTAYQPPRLLPKNDYWKVDRFVPEFSLDRNALMHPVVLLDETGVSREEMITSFIPDVMDQMNDGLAILTLETDLQIHSALPGHGKQYTVYIGTEKPRATSCVLFLNFVDSDGSCFASAKQKVAFANWKWFDLSKMEKSIRPCRMPSQFLDVAESISVTSAVRKMAANPLLKRVAALVS